MLKILSDKKNKTNFNSPIKNKLKEKKSKLFAKLQKGNYYKTIKGSKTPKYTNIKYNFSNILNLDKNLKRKEDVFNQNISNKILSNKNLVKNINNNISALKNKILDNNNTLHNLNYNYFNTYQNTKRAFSNKKEQKILNKDINREINKLNIDIDNIQDKIDKYKNLTELYKKSYDDINEKVRELKKEYKNLPEIIDKIENENKNLNYSCIKINSDIAKIKYKLYELEKNKRKIRWNLFQMNNLYK